MFQSLLINWIGRQSTLSVAINQDKWVEDVFFISVRRKISISILTVATRALCTWTCCFLSPIKKVLQHSHISYAASLQKIKFHCKANSAVLTVYIYMSIYNSQYLLIEWSHNKTSKGLGDKRLQRSPHSGWLSSLSWMSKCTLALLFVYNETRSL